MNVCQRNVARFVHGFHYAKHDSNLSAYGGVGIEVSYCVRQRTLSQCSRNRHSWKFWTLIHRYNFGPPEKFFRGKLRHCNRPCALSVSRFPSRVGLLVFRVVWCTCLSKLRCLRLKIDRVTGILRTGLS